MMNITSHFEAICICGFTNHIQRDQTVFTCTCGRRSIIDFTAGYSERELIEILNNLDVQRDVVARAIEVRRDRRMSR